MKLSRFTALTCFNSRFTESSLHWLSARSVSGMGRRPSWAWSAKSWHGAGCSRSGSEPDGASHGDRGSFALRGLAVGYPMWFRRLAKASTTRSLAAAS